jgi:hypothetical protein
MYMATTGWSTHIAKFEEEEEEEVREKSMDELDGHVKAYTALHTFDNSDCPSSVQSSSSKKAKGDSTAAASFAAAGDVKID